MKNRKTIVAMLMLAFATTALAQQKLVGGDISMLKKYVDEGAIYKDRNGNATEPLTLFREAGWNAMRVRLFVDPSKASATHKKEGVIQDLDYVVALSKSIKEAGFSLMLDFHYSDTWTDPGQHSTPSAWSTMSVAERTTAIYDYTKSCLQQLKAAGAEPDIIQPGNEITYGMLWPSGHVYPNGTGASDGGTWDNFTAYLASAIKGCREECPQAKIAIQTEMHNAGNVVNYYNVLARYASISYDIIALSYYPDFHGTLETLDGTLSKLEQQHPEKEIMIVETGYGFKWKISGSKFDYTATYPTTEEGQRKFAADLVTVLNSHERVTGLYWWFPEDSLFGLVFKANGGEDWSKQITSGYWNASLFDQETGRAQAALYELKNFLGPASVGGINAARSAGNAWYTIDGRRLNGKPAASGLYINNGKKAVIK